MGYFLLGDPLRRKTPRIAFQHALEGPNVLNLFFDHPFDDETGPGGSENKALFFQFLQAS